MHNQQPFSFKKESLFFTQLALSAINLKFDLWQASVDALRDPSLNSQVARLTTASVLWILDRFSKQIPNRCNSDIRLSISLGWKIQKMVKKSWLSVKKMCIRCEKYQKKFGLNWRFPWRAAAKTCSLGFGSAICPCHRGKPLITYRNLLNQISKKRLKKKEEEEER